MFVSFWLRLKFFRFLIHITWNASGEISILRYPFIGIFSFDKFTLMLFYISIDNSILKSRRLGPKYGDFSLIKREFDFISAGLFVTDYVLLFLIVIFPYLFLLIEIPHEKVIEAIENGWHLKVIEKDKEKPQCHIWMDNENNITITSNKDDDEIETITMAPSEIVTSCQKGGDTSTIKQTPTEITIEVDKFNLNSKETNLTSENATAIKAKTLSCKGDSGTTIDDGSKVAISASNITIG